MEFEENLMNFEIAEDILEEVNAATEQPVVETNDIEQMREKYRRYSRNRRQKVIHNEKLYAADKKKKRLAKQFSRQKKKLENLGLSLSPESAWRLKAEIQQNEKSKSSKKTKKQLKSGPQNEVNVDKKKYDQGSLSSAQCRLCFKNFYSNEKKIALSYVDAINFKDLTGLKLSLKKIYPRKMCTACDLNLKNFVMFRKKLIKEQKKFYASVGFYAQDPERDSFFGYASPEKEIDIKDEEQELFIIQENQLVDIKEEKDEFATIKIETKKETLGNFDVYLPISSSLLGLDESIKLNLRPRVKNIKPTNATKKSMRVKIPVRCPHCSEMITGLATHRRNMHNLRRWKYTCDMCNFSSTKHKTMTEHMKMETDRGAGIGKSSTKSILKSKCKTELCNHCGKFITNLKAHLYALIRDNKFFCDMCNFTTHRKCFLQGHLERRHMQSTILPCDHCRMKFRFQTDLHRHKLNSHGPRKMQCNLCPSTCRSAEMLRKHKDKFHKNNRIHKCDMCDVVLSSEGGLRYHRNMHLNKREYKCPKCLNAFCTPARFHRHPCNEPLNFSCEAPGCSSVHSRIDNFRVHVKKHSNIPDNVMEAMLSKARQIQENHVKIRYIREKL